MKRIATAILVAAGLAVAGGTGTAHAAQLYYCPNPVAGNGFCEGDLHSLVGNEIYAQTSGSYVCAGAHDTSHNNYASYVCSYSYTYHCYSGSTLLYPLTWNRESNSRLYNSRESWGVGALCQA